jgi:hypothetical protein
VPEVKMISTQKEIIGGQILKTQMGLTYKKMV